MQYPIRYDEFDYQKFGAQKRWLYIPTAAMLTSYEMEIKGCHEKENSYDIHSKILEKYMTYLSNLMFEGKLDYNNGRECNYTKYDEFEEEQVIMHNSANFNKDDCLAAIAGNNIFDIDISKLTNVIYGKEQLPGANSVAVTSIGTNSASLDLPENMVTKIKTYSEPELRKKVVELTNEKVKWDRSIAVATQIGLLFYEKGLEKPVTEKLFFEEYNKYFEGLPRSTALMIYKALPPTYRNTGGSPAKVPTGADDDTVDRVIQVSTYAGYLSHKEGLDVLDELGERLAEDEYEAPTDTHLNAIKKACRKVAGKYT